MDYFGWVNIALILCSPRGIENNVGNWLNICVHKIPLKAMKPSVARVLIWPQIAIDFLNASLLT